MERSDAFAGRVAFVTAAAGQGLGQAIARRFAEGGAAVAALRAGARLFAAAHDDAATVAAVSGADGYNRCWLGRGIVGGI